jgi:hypothetical protein
VIQTKKTDLFFVNFRKSFKAYNSPHKDDSGKNSKVFVGVNVGGKGKTWLFSTGENGRANTFSDDGSFVFKETETGDQSQVFAESSSKNILSVQRFELKICFLSSRNELKYPNPWIPDESDWTSKIVLFFINSDAE